MELKRKDLPKGPGGKSKFVLTNPPKKLETPELPLGILRYEDAKNLGKNTKDRLNKFNVKQRLAHEEAVREYLNKAGYSSDGNILNLPAHIQAKIDKETKKERKQKLKKILAALTALGLTASAISYRKFYKKKR